MRRGLLVGVFGLLGCALAWASPARACSCVPPLFGFVAPVEGAVDVPTNTRIWAGATDQIELVQVTGAQELPVTGTVTRVGAFVGELFVFAPAAPLVPGAAYRATVDGQVYAFTVGAGPDTEAPSPPTISDRFHAADTGWGGLLGDDSCDSGEDRHLYLTVEGHEALTVVDLDRTSNLDPTDPSGGVSVLATEDTVTVGWGGCVYNWEQQGPVGVRMGTFDLAGNFSGWNEDTEELVPAVGCGCTAAHPSVAGAPWPALGLLLVGLGARRRFRSRSLPR